MASALPTSFFPGLIPERNWPPKRGHDYVRRAGPALLVCQFLFISRHLAQRGALCEGVPDRGRAGRLRHSHSPGADALKGRGARGFKTIARQLLKKLKRDKFILDWRLRETARADVGETIRQELDQLPGGS